MVAISTNDLRKNLQLVIDALKSNQVFLLIHKSQPVAEIHPNTSLKYFSEATDTDIEQAAALDTEDDFLSKQALDYYMTLPPYETV